jgi:hypothetical protein
VRLIRLAIISIIFFSFLITGISLFFPSHVRLSKAVNILTTRDSTVTAIGSFKKWEHWHPLLLNSKNPRLSSGDTLHLGEASIVWTKKDSSEYVAEMRQASGRPVISGWKIIGEKGKDSLIVQWYMDFRLKWYPWEKFSSLLLEKRYGPQMEQGLTNLKNFLEH